jgi:hypothetical protein
MPATIAFPPILIALLPIFCLITFMFRAAFTSSDSDRWRVGWGGWRREEEGGSADRDLRDLGREVGMGGGMSSVAIAESVKVSNGRIRSK